MAKDLHTVIDLETLDKNQSAFILSIGATTVDINTGKEIRFFHEKISIMKDQPKRRIDGGTIAWWMSQTPEAIERVFCHRSDLSLKDALVKLRNWYHPDSKPWGNGASFDISILEHAYHQYRIPVPWKFWNIRDLRTLVDVGQRYAEFDKLDFPFRGTKHDALDDARHEAKYVIEINRRLKKVYGAWRATR